MHACCETSAASELLDGPVMQEICQRHSTWLKLTGAMPACKRVTDCQPTPGELVLRPKNMHCHHLQGAEAMHSMRRELWLPAAAALHASPAAGPASCAAPPGPGTQWPWLSSSASALQTQAAGSRRTSCSLSSTGVCRSGRSLYKMLYQAHNAATIIVSSSAQLEACQALQS